MLELAGKKPDLVALDAKKLDINSDIISLDAGLQSKPRFVANIN